MILTVTISGRSTALASVSPTSRHHETQIHSDPDVPLVRMVREFDAPPDRVFRAHAEADLIAQWLGPRNSEMRVDRFDCRTGAVRRQPATEPLPVYEVSIDDDRVRVGPRVIMQPEART